MASSSLEVHLDPCTVNSRKVLAALALLDGPFTLKKVDYFAGEHKSPTYTAINPCATVPCAVVDNTLVLTESNAIIVYATEALADKDHPAYPRDPKLRADINRWLFWETSAWFPSCYVYLIQNVVQPVLGNHPDHSALKQEEPRWRQLAGVLEQRLAKGERKWLAGNGDEPTVADLAVASSMHLWKRERFPIEGFPALRRWIARVEGLECWVRTQGAVERAFPERVSE